VRTLLVCYYSKLSVVGNLCSAYNWVSLATNPLEQFIILDPWPKCPVYHGSVLGVLLYAPLISFICFINSSNIYECLDTTNSDTIVSDVNQGGNNSFTYLLELIAVYVDPEIADDEVLCIPNEGNSVKSVAKCDISCYFIIKQTISYLFSYIMFIFVNNIIYDNLQIGPIVIYTPYLYFVFNLIFFGNILGLLPFSITITSTFILTLFISSTSFIGINIIGWVLHGIKIFKIFLPKGVPLYIAPMLVVIEVFSYLIRVLSITVRLFANILAGHALLKIVIASS